jgi:hypothetical protein
MNTSKDNLKMKGLGKRSAAQAKFAQPNGLSVISLLAIVVVASVQIPAEAQNAPIQPPNSLLQWSPPNQAVPQGAPPPPGDGNTPNDEISGDYGTPTTGTTPTTNNNPKVPTGTADPTAGTNFPTLQNANRPIIYVYAQTYQMNYPGTGSGTYNSSGTGTTGTTTTTTGTGQASDVGSQGTYRGLRMVMTIRGDNLTTAQANQITGVLTGVSLTSGPLVQQVVATNAQIEKLNEILYPDYSQQGYNLAQLQGDGRLKINNDLVSLANGLNNANIIQQTYHPQDTSLYTYTPTLPIVVPFARYFVLLGVVFATVMLIMAAYSMVMGHSYAGTRAIAVIAGLMTLLSAFTIYKIVILDLLNSNSTTVTSNSKSTSSGNAPVAPNLPVNPPTVTNTRPARSGVPVIPLSQN